MAAETILSIILYVLASILLITLIVLTIKLIITMNKVEKVVDNITDKVNTLDGVFSLIDRTTGKLTIVTDKVIDTIVLLIQKIFNKRKDGNNE